MVYNINSLVC